MNYPSPSYGAAPAAGFAAISTTKIIIIVVSVVVVITVVFFGVIAIALGVGLGIGLRESSDSSSSSLSAPTVSCNSSTAQCGCPATTPTFSSRLISGTTATTNSWPWIVALYTTNNKTCTGFLVTNRHVITSGNCVNGIPSANITAFVGTTTLSNRYSSGQVYSVSLVFTHPNYTTNSTTDDIAIVSLTTNVTLSSTVGICCITTNTGLPQVNEAAVVAGWGETSSTSTSSDSLQQAVVRIQYPSTCGVSATSDRQFCADYGSITTCPSDLGSPLMTSVNNLWTCTELVSGGNSTCNTVGIYTRLSYYSTFISNYTIYF